MADTVDYNVWEKHYSRCAHSSDVNLLVHEPRSCAMGKFEGSPVWQECAKCNDFREVNKEWDDVKHVFMAKYYPKAEGQKPCSACAEKAAKRRSQSRGGKYRAKKAEGLGDTIAKITKFFGIKPCSACERRRKSLNKKVPYGKRIRRYFFPRNTNDN